MVEGQLTFNSKAFEHEEEKCPGTRQKFKFSINLDRFALS